MYIQLISIHGLVRGENIEMGRDADTGGQVRYVIELARGLAECEGVTQVDLFTRRIRDKRVLPVYSEKIEQLSENCRIIRLPCGGGRYIRKERLWPFLDDYVDAMISFTRHEGLIPSIVHGHYADAGYVAKEVAAALDVPMVFTGHSLGKPKLDYLLEEDWSHEKAKLELNIDKRINAEQECLSVADLVITSTRHEKDTQYEKYHKDENLKFEVIPPGTDLDRFFPYYNYDMPGSEINEKFKQARVRMKNELSRFHFSSDKPIILALCRPDRRKNIGALIKTYGESKQLRAIANLAVLAGIREDIESMSDNEQKVLTDMLLLMDRYDLYGKMAIPKNHDSEFDVPELYRIAADSRGVFVNTAFIELFGLTTIEASAVGLPFVVTENGGPQDIVENCKSGEIVDVNNQKELTDSMLRMLTDNEQWDLCSNNGINLVRKFYSWETHCNHYLKVLKDVVSDPKKTPSVVGKSSFGKRLQSLDSLLISDIDHTLLGDDEALERLKEIIHEHRHHMGFGVASGRSLELVKQALTENDIEEIDIILSAVGTEIYYGNEFMLDKGWASHLRSKWKPEKIQGAMNSFSFVEQQKESHTQREFKLSYNLLEGEDAEECLEKIHAELARSKVAYSLIFSHGTFIDILPYRGSKGKAVRYLSGKWNIQLERVATAGDSGNDTDMLVGQTAGIIVGNHDEELAHLKTKKVGRLYFADAHCAGGIIEGLEHYGFINSSEPAFSKSRL